MNGKRKRKFVMAIILAPLLAPLLVIVGMAVSLPSVREVAQTSGMFFGVFVVGAFVSYLATLTVGAPIALALEVRGLFRPGILGGVGAVGGGFVFVVFGYSGSTPYTGLIQAVSFAGIGTLLGACVAMAFGAIVGFRPRRGNR